MFHGVGFDIANTRMELVHLMEKIQALQNDQSQISAIMVDRTGLPIDEVEGLFQQTAFVNSSEAVQRGIADEVSDINLPQGVPIQQIHWGQGWTPNNTRATAWAAGASWSATIVRGRTRRCPRTPRYSI